MSHFSIGFGGQLGPEFTITHYHAEGSIVAGRRDPQHISFGFKGKDGGYNTQMDVKAIPTVRCEHCRGKGKFKYYEEVMESCHHCHGKGTRKHGKKVCKRCHGAGQRKVSMKHHRRCYNCGGRGYKEI
jgi:RecJ-like exonuclease